MTSDRQFLRLFARLIIKELVKATIRKVIELIMEERLIYDEYTGQPTRVHITGGSADENGIESVVIEGPKEHDGRGVYSSYRRDIPKQVWDKLAPANPTRTQFADRVKSALHPLGLEVTYVDNHNSYNCVIITANGFFNRGEDDETKFDNESNFVGLSVRDNPEAFLPRYKPTDTLEAFKSQLNRKTAEMLHDQVCSKVPIDSRGLHLPDAQSVRDGALGKVGDTEVRVGGLANPVSCVSKHGIEIGDTVQSVDNGHTSRGDGVVIEASNIPNVNQHKVKWDFSGAETWWGSDELEVLARGEEVVGFTMHFGSTGDDAATVGCTCANPECTWRNSLNCMYDTYSDLEERGAIE